MHNSRSLSRGKLFLLFRSYLQIKTFWIAVFLKILRAFFKKVKKIPTKEWDIETEHTFFWLQEGTFYPTVSPPIFKIKEQEIPAPSLILTWKIFFAIQTTNSLVSRLQINIFWATFSFVFWTLFWPSFSQVCMYIGRYIYRPKKCSSSHLIA